MVKAGRRRKKGVSTPPILRTCSQAQRTKRGAEKATKRPGPRHKKVGSTPSILRTCSPLGRPAKPQNSQCSRQAGGEKRGLCAPNFHLCSHDQRRGKTAEQPMVKAGRRRKKGVSTPPVLRTCSQAQRTGKTVSLYHYITVT